MNFKNLETNSTTHFPKLGGTLTAHLTQLQKKLLAHGNGGCLAVAIDVHNSRCHFGNCFLPEMKLDLPEHFGWLAEALTRGEFDAGVNQATTQCCEIAAATDSAAVFLFLFRRADQGVAIFGDRPYPNAIIAEVCRMFATALPGGVGNPDARKDN